MLRSLKLFVLSSAILFLLSLLATSGFTATNHTHGSTGDSSAQDASKDTGQKKLDPTAWGSSHAGKPVPEFVHGDECLFCHRNDIGPGWQKNAHGIAVRQREDAADLVNKLNPPADVEFFLGSRHHTHFLKKAGYGKFAILSPKGEWDQNRFADRCAGCHSTAVDPQSRAFA